MVRTHSFRNSNGGNATYPPVINLILVHRVPKLRYPPGFSASFTYVLQFQRDQTMTAQRTLLIIVASMLAFTFTTCRKAEVKTLPALRFNTQVCVDKSGIGIEAFRMLIPHGWTFDGGIKWKLDNPGMPAVAAFRVKSPSGQEELEVFPNQPFFWTDNQMHRQMFPVGSRYYGNEVRPPLVPIDALKKIALPRFRGGVSGLRITKE